MDSNRTELAMELRRLTRVLLALFLFSSSASADLVSIPALGVRIQRGFRILPYAGPELANDIYSMTLDAAGNVVVSSQGYIKVLHDTNGDGLPDTATMFAPTAKGAMGLCVDGVDLYYSGDGGLYRLTDTD